MARYLENTGDDRLIHNDRPVERTPTEARQATLGRPVLYVLVIGIALAMIVWGLVEWWGAAIAPSSDTGPAPSATTTENAPAIGSDMPADAASGTAPAYQDTQPNQK